MIRPYETADWPSVWAILKPVFREARTYVYSPQMSEEEAHKVWIESPQSTFVALDQEEIVGTYYIKPNQPDQGGHICNCGYVVSGKARGKGVASRMCEDSQKQAIAAGFRGMQFNLVVSTNEPAVRLWKKHGFEIIGTLPLAFKDPELGYVDAFVMFKALSQDNL